MVRKVNLEVCNLHKVFSIGLFKRRHIYALNDINFKVYEGESIGIVGESGSGKSTLARTITGLYKPSSGKVIVDNVEVPSKMSHKEHLFLRKKIQMIFQDPYSSFDPLYTVRSTLEVPLKIHGMKDKNQRIEKTKAVLEKCGLTPVGDILNRYPHELSGGQLQRVAIARALLIDPMIIIADEPTSMLDVSIRLDIMNLLLDLKEESKISLLFITHDLAGARYMSDKIMIMYAGFILEFGATDDVITNPLHPYTELLKLAAPKPEEGLKPTIIEDKKDIPDLSTRYASCPFEPRCKKSMEVCRKELPPLFQLSENRFVRCFLYKK